MPLRRVVTPLLSKTRGCVAAWKAGLLTPAGALRDFVSETHHFAFPGGSNDPLALDPSPVPHLYLPGSTGNSATITLANSTAYFYTITYSDGTTTTDTQTSSGAGLLTFGGTDVKFAGLKIARILVTTDADHGVTIADIDFKRTHLLNSTTTTLTAVTGGQAVTINRTATGRKACAVVRPLLLFGTDDNLSTPDHANLNFAGGFTVLFAGRKFGTADQVPISKKANVGVTAGYTFRTTSGNILFNTADGTNEQSSSSNLDPNNAPQLWAGRVIRSEPIGAGRSTIWTDGVPNGGDSLVSVGDLSSVTPMYLGRRGNDGLNLDGEFFAAALFNRALSTAEIKQLERELIGVAI